VPQRLDAQPAPSGCLIEAPWLVNGGHGASFRSGSPRPAVRVAVGVARRESALPPDGAAAAAACSFDIRIRTAQQIDGNVLESQSPMLIHSSTSLTAHGRARRLAQHIRARPSGMALLLLLLLLLLLGWRWAAAVGCIGAGGVDGA
jgi:hypothetical protein